MVLPLYLPSIAEVNNLNSASGFVPEDVVWLQVAMNNSPLMHVLHSLKELLSDRI